MKYIHTKIIALLLVLVTSSAFSAIPLVEREALVKLYHATNGDQWGNHTNWLNEAGSESMHRWQL